MVDFIAGTTSPLLVTQESGTYPSRFLVLGVNALLQCKDPSSLTVMATDANRLKRLLEMIGQKIYLVLSEGAGSKPAYTLFLSSMHSKDRVNTSSTMTDVTWGDPRLDSFTIKPPQVLRPRMVQLVQLIGISALL